MSKQFEIRPLDDSCERIIKVGRRYYEWPSLRRAKKTANVEEFRGFNFMPGKPPMHRRCVNTWYAKHALVEAAPGDGHKKWLAWMEKAFGRHMLPVVLNWMTDAAVNHRGCRKRPLLTENYLASHGIVVGLDAIMPHYLCTWLGRLPGPSINLSVINIPGKKGMSQGLVELLHWHNGMILEQRPNLSLGWDRVIINTGTKKLHIRDVGEPPRPDGPNLLNELRLRA